jgi:hypothetical protein
MVVGVVIVAEVYSLSSLLSMTRSFEGGYPESKPDGTRAYHQTSQKTVNSWRHKRSTNAEVARMEATILSSDKTLPA